MTKNTRTKKTLKANHAENQGQPVSQQLCVVFNNSQHVQNLDSTLKDIKRIYKNSKFDHFETGFRNCIRKLLQSESTTYFKTSCEFVAKFLQHLSKLSDDARAAEPTIENAIPNLPPPSSKSRGATGGKKSTTSSNKPSTKRRKTTDDDSDEDELLPKKSLNKTMRESMNSTRQNEEDEDSPDELTIVTEVSFSCKRKSTGSMPDSNVTMSMLITPHDNLISTCFSTVILYAQVIDETCRYNALYLLSKLLTSVDSLDEEICIKLKSALVARFRDKKSFIRVQAVLASRTFQDYCLIQEGFRYHFYKDPEPTVRKTLIQVMDPRHFGYGFLVESTQDSLESMRKIAFHRLGKIEVKELNQKQLHTVLHNGIVEREQKASYTFRNQTLQPWLSQLYDGIDLYKLLSSLNILDHPLDIERLLELVYHENLSNLIENSTTTKLHKVVEHFRTTWLTEQKVLQLQNDKIDEKVAIIWLSLIKFCKSNQTIQKVKVRTVHHPEKGADTIEQILESQEQEDEELIDLYELLLPDLVNLVDFINRYVRYASDTLKQSRDVDKNFVTSKLEFVYQQLICFCLTYEIGDEVERKTVQETFDQMLKEDLLTGKFSSFIPPIIKSLYHLVYSKSSKLMIDYIAEMIHNVRSHLEDLASSSSQSTMVNQRAPNAILPRHSTIKGPSAINAPKSAKKVGFRDERRADRYRNEAPDEFEYEMAKIKISIEELLDELESHIKKKEFDKAKEVNDKITILKADLEDRQMRRSSIVSDMSRLSMVVQSQAGINDKLCSTMISPSAMNESTNSVSQINSSEDPKIFKNRPNDLLKCLQMYYGCMQSVKVEQVPHTMLNHLRYLTYEALDDTFKDNYQIRTLMVECTGLTAFLDAEFAKDENTMMMFVSACYECSVIELRTSGFKSFVDVVCHHKDLEFPVEKIEKFMRSSLKKVGRFDPKSINKEELDFLTTLIEGSAKLLYFKKISSPEVLSWLIIWWYHPLTPSKLKQFIGIYLPHLVNELSRFNSTSIRDENNRETNYLQELLQETFVKSIEYLHDNILGPDMNVMDSTDMASLINFLSNLVPTSIIPAIEARIDLRLDDMGSVSDLTKYLKQAKVILKTQLNANKNSAVISTESHVNESLQPRPLNLFD